MNDLLARCRWPELPEMYNQALRSAVEFILGHFKVSGVVVSGTIMRGCPDPASDLDIYVIHQEDYRQRIQKYFNNVPTEIFINPPQAVAGYFAEEQLERRPITAHILTTGFVILKLDPVIDELQMQAKSLLSKPPEAPTDLAPSRYFPALLYEDAVDVRESDPATAQMILCRAVTKMLEYCFVETGNFIPRQKSMLSELAKIDLKTAELGQYFFSSTSLRSRLKIAEKIADRTIKQRGFFEWESTPEVLEIETDDQNIP